MVCVTAWNWRHRLYKCIRKRTFVLETKCPSLYSKAPVNYEGDLVSISLFSIEGKNEVEFLIFGDKCLSVLVSSGFHNEILQTGG